MTPALALMKKRNDEIKSSFLRGPMGFQPLPRPRSFSLGLKRDTWKPAFLREQSNDEDKWRPPDPGEHNVTQIHKYGSQIWIKR